MHAPVLLTSFFNPTIHHPPSTVHRPLLPLGSLGPYNPYNPYNPYYPYYPYSTYTILYAYYTCVSLAIPTQGNIAAAPANKHRKSKKTHQGQDRK